MGLFSLFNKASGDSTREDVFSTFNENEFTTEKFMDGSVGIYLNGCRVAVAQPTDIVVLNKSYDEHQFYRWSVGDTISNIEKVSVTRDAAGLYYIKSTTWVPAKNVSYANRVPLTSECVWTQFIDEWVYAYFTEDGKVFLLRDDGRYIMHESGYYEVPDDMKFNVWLYAHVKSTIDSCFLHISATFVRDGYGVIVERKGQLIESEKDQMILGLYDNWVKEMLKEYKEKIVERI